MRRNGSSIIQQTRHFWSAYTEADVSLEDAREAVANAVDFFQVLSEWDKSTSEGDDETCSSDERMRSCSRIAAVSQSVQDSEKPKR